MPETITKHSFNCVLAQCASAVLQKILPQGTIVWERPTLRYLSVQVRLMPDHSYRCGYASRHLGFWGDDGDAQQFQFIDDAITRAEAMRVEMINIDEMEREVEVAQLRRENLLYQ